MSTSTDVLNWNLFSISNSDDTILPIIPEDTNAKQMHVTECLRTCMVDTGNWQFGSKKLITKSPVNFI